MNSIPLRAYNREIEEAIEQKQYDEAIAHCRHILQTYPKHIETYRLLGKAYLESQRYGNAADLFQRVLSSVPNDFISHVGMSIIREDESNLDAAIWHMERAFESQPYNGAIQGELRRLYGLRDGVEPPKIRLTRGALARMYAKGNLYEQAIAELRATLAEDPHRADLQVMLADMYAKNRQTSEAIEVCTSLLKRLPYCMEANRLLTKLLPEPDRSEEIKICKQRLIALDPYEAHISSDAPRAEDVPDQAVMISRLDWDGGTPLQDADERPEWAATVGADLDGLGPDEDSLPSWLAESPSYSGDRGELREDAEEELPPWVRETSDERPVAKATGSEVPAIIPEDEALDVPGGDIPDWLQEMAPAQPEQHEGGEELKITAEDLEKDLPEWLDEEANGATDTIIEWLGEKSPQAEKETEDEEPEWLQSKETDTADALSQEAVQEDEELPSWLRELSAVAPDPSGPATEHETPKPESPEHAEIPEWLQGLGETTADPEPKAEAPEEAPAEPAEIPEWLQGLGETTAESEPKAEALEAAPAEPVDAPEWPQELGEPAAESEPKAEAPEAAETIQVPEWLQGMTSSPQDDEELLPFEAEIKTPNVDMPEWLKDVDTGPLRLRETTPAEERAEPGEIPEWLDALRGEEPAEAETISPTKKTTELLPQEEHQPEPSTSEEEPSETPEWLQEFEEAASPAEEAPKVATESIGETGTVEEVPDWLQEIPRETPAVEETQKPEAADLKDSQKEPQAEAADIPEWMRHIVPEDQQEAPPEPETKPEVEFGSAEEALAWLESLAAKQGVSEDELLTKPEERPETPPEWVFEAEEKASEDVIADESETPELVAPPQEQQETVEEPHPDAETINETPEWLADLQPAPEAEQAEHVPSEEPVEDGEVAFSDTDAAMAWLESLAAKQGVSEEELISQPEDRPESLPDLVVDAMEDEMLEAATDPEKETVPEEIPTTPEEEVKFASEEDLSQEISAPSSTEQMEEDIPEDLPPWLRKSLIADSEQEHPAEEPSTATEEAGTLPDELPDWLRDALDEQEVEEETESVEDSELSARTDEGLEAVSEELPDWLRYAIEEGPEQAIVAEEPADTPSEIPAEEAVISESKPEASPEAPTDEVEKQLPEEVDLLELNTISLAQLERLPGVGFRRAQTIVTYRQEHGPFEKLEDLLKIPGIDNEFVEALRHCLTVIAPEAERAPTTTSIQVEDKWHALQLEAQSELRAGNYSQGLEKYATLIKKNKRLEEVITDLEELQFEVPNDVCVDVLQTLGDAYVKINELQKALDTYSKAEDLLR